MTRHLNAPPESGHLLTQEDWATVRQLRAQGYLIGHIAEHFGLSTFEFERQVGIAHVAGRQPMRLAEALTHQVHEAEKGGRSGIASAGSA